MIEQFDVIFVGGGLVGNIGAYLLAQNNLRVAMVEARDINTKPNKPDNRSIVLTYSSYVLLNTIGVWPELASAAYPIKKVHVSDRGHFGAARFDAKEQQLPVFGYIIPAEVLTRKLQQLAQASNITFFSPAQVTKANCAENIAQVTLTHDNREITLKANLLIATDGTNSQIRELNKIKTTSADYQQTAIIAIVQLAEPHQHVAYERLTTHGPIALLPREDRQCGLVWTLNRSEIAEMMALPDAEFIKQLQYNFGYRLGKFVGVSRRESYPLKLVQAQEQILPGLVLLGNAARTVHPLAGQGFNLALRDVALLIEILLQARAENKSVGEFSLLQAYQRTRMADQQRIIRFTDRTVRLFAQDFFPASAVRRLGIIALDILPAAKKIILRQLLGLSGQVAKLAAGVPLP